MPAKWGKVKRWLEKQGAQVEHPSSGSHWKIRFEGWVFPISAHNGLKEEISNVYLREIAKHFKRTLAELLREL